MVEQWKTIGGFPNYQVSDMGRVRSMTRRPRILKQSIVKGYLAVSLRATSASPSRVCAIHRLVARAFCGEPVGQVRHLDGDAMNNVASNLCWGTAKENAADRERHGRTRKGEAHARSVLDDSLVRRIRALHYLGLGPTAIGNIFGLQKARVHEVTSRRTWKHVV